MIDGGIGSIMFIGIGNVSNDTNSIFMVFMVDGRDHDIRFGGNDVTYFVVRVRRIIFVSCGVYVADVI